MINDNVWNPIHDDRISGDVEIDKPWFIDINQHPIITLDPIKINSSYSEYMSVYEAKNYTICGLEK